MQRPPGRYGQPSQFPPQQFQGQGPRPGGRPPFQQRPGQGLRGPIIGGPRPNVTRYSAQARNIQQPLGIAGQPAV